MSGRLRVPGDDCGSHPMQHRHVLLVGREHVLHGLPGRLCLPRRALGVARAVHRGLVFPCRGRAMHALPCRFPVPGHHHGILDISLLAWHLQPRQPDCLFAVPARIAMLLNRSADGLCPRSVSNNTRRRVRGLPRGVLLPRPDTSSQTMRSWKFHQQRPPDCMLAVRARLQLHCHHTVGLRCGHLEPWWHHDVPPVRAGLLLPFSFLVCHSCRFGGWRWAVVRPRPVCHGAELSPGYVRQRYGRHLSRHRVLPMSCRAAVRRGFGIFARRVAHALSCRLLLPCWCADCHRLSHRHFPHDGARQVAW